MKSYNVKENHIGSAVSEIFRYTQRIKCLMAAILLLYNNLSYEKSNNKKVESYSYKTSITIGVGIEQQDSFSVHTSHNN